MRWPWVVVPSLIVLGVGALVLALDPGEDVLIGLVVLAGLASSAVNLLLIEPRRREEQLARPGWEFHPSPRIASARAGQAFAAAALLALMMRFAAPNRVAMGALAFVVAMSLGIGVRLVTRLVRHTPVLRLSATGIEVRGTRYAWERIGGVELNGDRENTRLDVLVAGRRRSVTLRPADVDASLLFLMDLIGYYQSCPEHRTAIGQAEEARRVHGLLLSARLAAGLRGGPRPIVMGASRVANG
ncbi:hypothetical protein [Dactylosporangium sp. NPDC051484]|uniref:hypothetical protein n=1 Tax=Dactylosporangium sp. NPDC051484 TaxID=3154942 RepID=UPI00344B755F